MLVCTSSGTTVLAHCSIRHWLITSNIASVIFQMCTRHAMASFCATHVRIHWIRRVLETKFYRFTRLSDLSNGKDTNVLVPDARFVEARPRPFAGSLALRCSLPVFCQVKTLSREHLSDDPCLEALPGAYRPNTHAQAGLSLAFTATRAVGSNYCYYSFVT